MHDHRFKSTKFLGFLGVHYRRFGAVRLCCPGGPAAAPSAAASSEEAQNWLTGNVPADISGDFKIMSWEDEGEMRKFLLHIDRFFEPSIRGWNLKLSGASLGVITGPSCPP